MSHKLTKHQFRSHRSMLANKELREQTKDSKRQRQLERALRPGAPPRRRDWDDDDAGPAFEPIRKAPSKIVVAPGVAERADSEPEHIGTVIEVRSGDSLVMCDGHVLSAALPPGLRVAGLDARSALSVGDRVALEPMTSTQARIVDTLPRKSALTRRVYDPSRRSGVHKGHALAANVDLATFVCTPKEPPFRPRLMDRYLVAASRDDLPAMICLNKIDLGVEEETETWLRGYEAVGATVLRVSALTGEGIPEMRRAIEGKVSLFTGHSGVGKSSLLNALEPGLALKVGTVTESAAGQGKGRHTTSSARLVPLSTPETFVVDSPGIRAFGIKGISPNDLASHFADIRRLAPECRYDDCLHRGEPSCAVEDASRGDAFLRARLVSYRSLLGEL